MIHLNQVSLQFGDRILFDDVTLNLSKKYRYVVVGANGAGKSTFLSLIAGERESTLGTVTIPKNLQVGWMRQDYHLYDHLTVVEVVMKGKKLLWDALEEKNSLLESPDWSEKHSDRISAVEEKIEQLSGYRAQADAEALLIGLGITEDQHDKPLKQFSGGWKMRVLLAQLLFNNPDILLLDEPTNYLDITSIAWLENYLVNAYQGLVILVSHDQKFLEAIGTCVLDLDYGQILNYPGTYSQFLTKKEEIAEQKAKEFALTEARVKKMQRFIERFRSKPTKAKQCSSREKMIEKVKWPELGRSSRQNPHFVFKQERHSGKVVLKGKGLCKLFDPDILIGPFDLEVLRGERIALIGKNGVGKTTLLYLLTDQLIADEGSAQMGHHVEMAMFHQEHKHLFTGNETVWTWFETHVSHLPEEKRRQTLGQMLFRQEDMNKKITMLSGGEMARLLIGKIMTTKANLLILDEPTNHLDLESKQALESALIQFKGTVLFVSHDRHFIKRVATQVIEINPNF